MLKYILKSLEGVNEAHKSLYKEVEGVGFVLQVEDAVSKADYDAQAQKLVDANEESARRRRTVERFKALGDTPEEIEAKIAAAGKSNPDHEKVIADLKATHAAEREADKAKFNSVVKKNALADLKASLAGEGILPDALDMAAATAAERFSVGDDGAVRVLNADKTGPLAGSGADGYATAGDLAKELAASMPWAMTDGGKGGSGKPPASKGKGSDKTILRADYDKLDAAGQREVAMGGTKVVDE